MLSWLDWVALTAYLGVIAAIGFWVARKNKDFHQFMFGGGHLPWWAVGVSLIATSVSATTFLGNPADAFANDMAYLMCNIGVVIAIVFIAFVFIPRFQRLKVTSAYELLEKRFSRPVRLLAAALYCGHLLLRTGILLYGPALVLSGVFGLNLVAAILVMSLLAIVYTYFGGLRAVVWTDVLQFGVLFGGGLLTLFYCVDAIGSWSVLAEAAREAGKTKIFHTSWDPAQARTLLSAGLVYAVFEIAIRGCDQQFVQRYMACKDTTAANASSFLSAGLGFLVAWLFFWVGAALFVYFRVEGILPLPADVGVNDVFPYFILKVLPPGVTGLLAAAILAAAMSSLDSAITALTNTAVVDFRGDRGDGHAPSLTGARKWVVFWGAMGTLAAFVCAVGQQSLLTKALFVTSLFTGPLLGMFLFAFFRPATRPNCLFAGTVLGMLSLLPFSKIPFLPEGWWQPLYTFSWPWNPVISLTATAIATLLLDRVSKMRADRVWV